jgi:hypothetical protein
LLSFSPWMLEVASHAIFASHNYGQLLILC